MRRIRGHQLYGYGKTLCLATSFLLSPLGGTLSRAQQSSSNPNPVREIVNSIKTRQFDQALEECNAALKQAPADKRIWGLQGTSTLSVYPRSQGKTCSAISDRSR
jgi:hypothetical protein